MRTSLVALLTTFVVSISAHAEPPRASPHQRSACLALREAELLETLARRVTDARRNEALTRAGDLRAEFQRSGLRDSDCPPVMPRRR